MAAVDLGRISAAVGYSFIAKDFSTSSANLPQRIAVVTEANTANQTDLDTSEWQATTLKAVGDRYGFGSPAYLIARICLPNLGGIPLVFYPQAAPMGATAKQYSITPVGTANANATHTVIVSGRNGIDGQFYSYNVNVGDGSPEISAKIADALSAVLGCPFSTTSTEYEAVLASKWKGLTAEGLNVRIDTNNKDAGITYTVASEAAGSGTPSISAALAVMKTKWNTIVINSYGTVATICDALEAWNGIPDPDAPSGQYVGTVMKPAVAITGSVSADPSSFTNPRAANVTIAIAPAPNSEGLAFEAAANMAVLQAVIAQNSPELDVIYKNYIDMPVPANGDIGAMADSDERDIIVKKGCSTVMLVNNQYQVIDFVTTYHPDGELNPVFRYVRDVSVAFNIRYSYVLIENSYVKGKVIVSDDATVDGDKKILKPSTFKSVLIDQFFDDLEARALCTDREFFKSSLAVNINATNNNRVDTSFSTKLTGIARISATENTIGFNFGSNT